LSHNLLIADSLIAATALSLDMPLVSKNQRDHRFIADIKALEKSKGKRLMQSLPFVESFRLFSNDAPFLNSFALDELLTSFEQRLRRALPSQPFLLCCEP